jgi:hypothetical protein
MNLDNVTLVCVEGSLDINIINDSVKALLISSKDIKFDSILLLSPVEPDNLPNNIIHHEISSMSWLEYNQFIVSDLTKYINTDYCILIQTDGFILNSSLWTDEFLKYDYIGHVWDFINLPYHLPGVDPEVVARKGAENLNRVGNGGFSFRSKKLLDATATIPVKCEKGEDAFICNDQFDYLTDKGIVFGTVEIARLFSEDPNDHYCRSYQPTFGFHGDKNLIHSFNVNIA